MRVTPSGNIIWLPKLSPKESAIFDLEIIKFALIAPLINKVDSGKIIEVILALTTSLEGDTTNFYLYKKLQESKVKLTTIARGVSIGDELEYVDDITLGRSIVNRTPYETVLKQ